MPRGAGMPVASRPRFLAIPPFLPGLPVLAPRPARPLSRAFPLFLLGLPGLALRPSLPSLSFPRSLSPTFVIGERESKVFSFLQRGRGWAGSVVRLAGVLHPFFGFPLKAAGMTVGLWE